MDELERGSGVVRDRNVPDTLDIKRAVEADEQLGVQSFLQRGHRMVDQPAAAADVEAHVVALRRHAVDVARGDPDQARQVGRREFFQPSQKEKGHIDTIC